MRHVAWLTAFFVVVPELSAQADQTPRTTAGGQPIAVAMALPPPLLLSQKSVQEELGVTPDQQHRLQELFRRDREAAGRLGSLSADERQHRIRQLIEDDEKAISDVLKPEQQRRLGQISLQLYGAQAFADPGIGKELNLTPEERGRAIAVLEETGKRMDDLRPGSADEDAIRRQTRELDQRAADRIVAMLNPDQQARWKQMVGRPFKGEVKFGPPPGYERPQRP